MVANVENIVFADDSATPWHGLGGTLSREAPLDQWRVEAGLDWTAERNPMYLADGTRVKGNDLLTRSDNSFQLGIVTPRYNIVQPSEIIEFYRDLTQEMGYTMETAGSLASGKRIWALARTGESTRIMGQDQVDGYLLLATSFDGTLATSAMHTSVRVVCQNTLYMAIGEAGENGVRIPHRAEFSAESVKQELGIYGGVWETFEEDANLMANKKVTKAEAVQFLLDVMYPKGDYPDLGAKDGRATKNIMRLINTYESGVGQQTKSAEGTVWGLVNGVTRFVDHESLAHSNDSRLQSAWFGKGKTMKANAYQLGLAMAA